MSNRIPLIHGLSLDQNELEISYVRASGPGGQNVNKVSSAAQLRFDLVSSASLPVDVKARAAHLATQWLTQWGEILIHADRFRTQAANREDAINRLIALLNEAIPAPKRRRKFRPGVRGKARRLEGKKRRAAIKANRRPPSLD